MTVSISGALAQATCDAHVDALDVGGGTAQLIVYDDTGGAAPANVDASLGTHVALVTFSLPNPAFGAAADLNPNFRATLNSVSSVLASASGTPQFGRFLSRAGTPTIQGSCGTSGTDIIISASPVASGATISVTSATYTILE